MIGKPKKGMSTDKKLNVLFADAGSGWGGTATYLYNLLYSLDRKQLNPTVLFYGHSAATKIKQIGDLGIKIFFLPKLVNHFDNKKGMFFKYLYRANAYINALLFSISIVKLLVKQRINIMFLNNDVFYHLPSVFAGKMSRVPIICRKAGYGRGRLMQRVLSKYVDIFLAECEATKQDLLENHIKFNELITFYLGVDLSLYEMGEKNTRLLGEMGISPGSIIIGSISRYQEGKGQVELIDAACKLIGDYRNVFLLMVGDYVDEKSNSLEFFMRKIPDILKNKVKFLGWRDDIKEILALIDIFVHVPTTWIEGLPLCGVEAVAAGKPMIVSSNGGLPEIVKENYNGFVTPPGNIEELMNALKKLIENEDLRITMGRNSRTIAEKYFDIRQNASKTFEIIWKTARGKGLNWGNQN